MVRAKLAICQPPPGMQTTRRMRRQAFALRRVVGDVEVHACAVGPAVVRQDVVLQAQRMLDLRLEQRGMAYPLPERAWERHEAQAFRGDLLPAGTNSTASPPTHSRTGDAAMRAEADGGKGAEQ